MSAAGFSADACRPRPYRRWVLGSLLGVLFSLCAGGCVLLVSKDEYRSYRAAQVSDVAMSRLLHMRAYLDAYPDGRWAPDFRSAQEAQEALVFEENRDNREGLNRYLQVYPQGLFAEQARSRLSALSLLEARKRDQQARARTEAAQRKAADELRRRTWVGRFMGELIARVVALTAWEQPIAALAAANPELSTLLARPPRPRCSNRECLKYYTGLYTLALPTESRLERTAQLLLRLRMISGKVMSIDILLPGWGFSRWFESEHGELIVDGDPEERKGALAFAQAEIERLLRSHGDLQPAATTTFSFEAPSIAPADEFIDTSAENLAAVAILPGKSSLRERTGTADEEMAEMPEVELDVFELAPERTTTTEASAPGRRQKLQGVVTAEPGATQPRVLSAYRLGDLLVQVFAAEAGAAAPAYDGIHIEP